MPARGVKKGKTRPKSSFAGKKILLTGGAGFLGRSVLRLLVERGARLKAIFIPRSDHFDPRLPTAGARGGETVLSGPPPRPTSSRRPDRPRNPAPPDTRIFFPVKKFLGRPFPCFTARAVIPLPYARW